MLVNKIADKILWLKINVWKKTSKDCLLHSIHIFFNIMKKNKKFSFYPKRKKKPSNRMQIIALFSNSTGLNNLKNEHIFVF